MDFKKTQTIIHIFLILNEDTLIFLWKIIRLLMKANISTISKIMAKSRQREDLLLI